VASLVEGTLAQSRLLAICPKDPSDDDLAGVFTRSMENW